MSDTENENPTARDATDDVADRFAIEALRGEFTDAAMMGDFDRLGSLFTEDATWSIPEAGIAFTGRATIRDGVRRMQGSWEYFLQTTHPGTIRIAGDDAEGRAYVTELGRMRDGTSHGNQAIYHDEYRRTREGWKFATRAYEVLYLDETPLPGKGHRPGKSTY